MHRWLWILVIVAMGLAGCEPVATSPTYRWSMYARTQQTTWDVANGTGKRLATEHYHIYTTLRDPAIMRNLPGFMEASHSYYLKLTGLEHTTFEYPGPLVLYVMDNREQWAALTKHHFGEESTVADELRAGGYTVRGVCALWDIGYMPTLSVASHEGLHQFFYHRLEHRIPMWAEEGLCAVVEGFDTYNGDVTFTPNRNVSRFTTLRDVLVRDYWIDLDELLPMTSGQAISGMGSRGVGYYAQLWSLVLYIRSVPEYRAGFEQMIADAQAGEFGPVLNMPNDALSDFKNYPGPYNTRFAVPLFEHYITDDIDGFEKEWKQFARELAGLGRF